MNQEPQCIRNDLKVTTKPEYRIQFQLSVLLKHWSVKQVCRLEPRWSKSVEGLIEPFKGKAIGHSE